MKIPSRLFGKTGLPVSALGFGAGHIGSPALPDPQVERLLNTALDLGVNLIDTARGYGLSEERIGKFLAPRRGEFVLSTKIGYNIPGFQDWTGPIIGAGVKAALERLRTDYLDIVHLHSCPREVLERGEVVTALENEVRAGRVRVAAYSGDNEALEYAVAGNRFASVQCSVNITDQQALANSLPQAMRKQMGVIAKRPLANVPWRFTHRPAGNYAEVYWERWKTMALDPGGLDWSELAIRFTAFLPEVHSCIVGTSRLEHLQQMAEYVSRGPLPESLAHSIRAAFQAHGQPWTGQT